MQILTCSVDVPALRHRRAYPCILPLNKATQPFRSLLLQQLRFCSLIRGPCSGLSLIKAVRNHHTTVQVPQHRASASVRATCQRRTSASAHPTLSAVCVAECAHAHPRQRPYLTQLGGQAAHLSACPRRCPRVVGPQAVPPAGSLVHPSAMPPQAASSSAGCATRSARSQPRATRRGPASAAGRS